MSGTGWWARLLGRGEPQPPAPARGPASPAAPASPTASAAPAGPPAAPAGALRRPLVGRDGQVAGFEWLLTDAANRSADDWRALCQAAAAGARPGLVAPPAALLREPAWTAALPAGLWLALDAVPGVVPGAGAEAATPGSTQAAAQAAAAAALDAEQVAALRTRGVRVGAPALVPVAEPALDFVVATAAGAGLDTLLLAAQRWHEVQPRVRLVALGLTTLDEAEQLLARGFRLAGGRLGRGGAQPAPQPMGAAAHRICGLLSQLAQDADTAVVAEAVRADVALGYRLLRYANSPSVGLRTPAETVEQAVAVLGRRELTRWLQVMLLAAAASRPAQRALQEHTLMRARLLERLAERRGEPEPGAFFTLGLLSTLDQLLQLPLAVALAPLRLRDEARQALLERRGPWAPQLALLDAMEDPDETRVWALATSLGHAAEFAEDAAAAWGWASGVDTGGAP